MYTELERLAKLSKAGLSDKAIISSLDGNLAPFDFHAQGQPQHYDHNGRYQAPIQVLIEAMKFGCPSASLEISLLEFNIYWLDTVEGRAIYPHINYLRFLENSQRKPWFSTDFGPSADQGLLRRSL